MSAEVKCWWCGEPADSREHKFKQSELVFNNGGKRQWVGNDAMVHGSEGRLRDVQGPNSAIVKFSPTMCQKCNNARSQAFDLAYDKFIQYMSANEATIAIDRRFRFSDVFGGSWPTQRTNLIKYWVKHICCMAAEHGLEVPPLLIAYLDDDDAGEPPHIRLDFMVQADLLRLRLTEGMDYGSFIGDVQGWSRQGVLRAIEGHVMWGWVMVTYTFDVEDPLGYTTFEGDLVQMGWISQVSEEYTLDPTDLMASELLAEYRKNTGRE